jgi:hypothetical protein
LNEDIVADAYSKVGFLASKADEWKKVHGAKSGLDYDIAKVRKDQKADITPCFVNYPKCKNKVDTKSFESIMKDLQVAVAPRGMPVENSKVLWVSTKSNNVFLQTCAAHKTPFDAVFLIYSPTADNGANEMMTFPLELCLQCHTFGGFTIPKFLDEKEVCEILMDKGPLSFFTLECDFFQDGTSAWDRLKVTNATLIDIKSEVEAQSARMTAKRAITLLRKAQQPHRAAPAVRGRGRGRGGARGRRGRGRGHEEPPHAELGDDRGRPPSPSRGEGSAPAASSNI